MKRKLSLSVSEFLQLLEDMTVQTARELDTTRARLEALRAAELPPG